MQSLTRAGLVKSQRGLNGGFTLAHDPEQLSILEVVNAVDPIQRYPECPLGIENHGRRLCPLHQRLDQAAAMVEKAFGDTKVIRTALGAAEPTTPVPLPRAVERRHVIGDNAYFKANKQGTPTPILSAGTLSRSRPSTWP